MNHICIYASFPGNLAGKESTCNVGGLGLIPWLGRFPWRREGQPTPVFWPGEFNRLYSPWGHKDSGVFKNSDILTHAIQHG